MRRGNDEFWQEGARYIHDGWWGGPLHLLLFFLFMALVVVGVVWIMRRVLPAPGVQAVAPAAIPAAADPAVAALRMRYASGEVSPDDFRQRMQDLTGRAEPAPPPAEPGPDDAPTAS